MTLDAAVAVMEGRDPSEIGYMALAAETFGRWDEATLAEARRSGVRVF